MKEFLALLLVAVMIVSFTACTTDSGESVNETPNTETPKTDPDEPGEESKSGLPLVEETETLTVFSQLDPKAAMMVTSYEDLKCYQVIEEKTNVNIEWLHPAGDSKEAFTLMVASGDYPDIIYWNWTNAAGGPEQYIGDGVIIDLKDLVEEYAPNLKKQFDKDDVYRKLSMTDEGTIWGFPLVYDHFNDPNGYPKHWIGPQMRQDWLDRVGAELPTNIEEWTNVLRIFKEEDADGDGDLSNEIPLIASNAPFGENMGLGGFAPAWGILWDFYNDNGTVKYGPIEEGARGFLETMSQWYQEGLLDKDFAGQDRTGVDSKINSGIVGSWWTGAPRWGYYVVANPDKSTFNPVPVKWPKTVDGEMYTTSADVKIPGGLAGAAISTSCENKELAVRWMDYLWSEEGSTIMNWGIEGESYVEENGMKRYTDEILNNPEGLNVEQAIAKYTSVPLSGWAVMQDGYAKRATLSLPGQLEMYDFWSDASPDLILPRYTLTRNESDRVAKILSNILTYVSENAIKMILGELPMEHFDTYVKEIEAMGLEEAIEAITEAVERYNSR